MAWKLISSRFSGKCAVCGGQIEAGTQIYWRRRQAMHVGCATPEMAAAKPQPGRPVTEPVPEPPAQTEPRLVGQVRYVAPGEPEPDPAEWEYRKTSKKGNRVYVRRALSMETVRQFVLDALSQIKPEVKEITVKIADRPEVKLNGRQHPALQEVLTLAANRKHILLIGPAGCGKSHLAQQVAEVLGLRFGFVPCTAGMAEGQLTGRLIPTGEAGRFEYASTDFVRCYEEGGVFLLDEIDAADPNVLLVLNSALANGHLALPQRVEKPVAKRHPDFVLIAAANTYGSGANRLYVGRNQLDESTLDRFRIGQVVMDYDENLERSLMADSQLLARLWEIREKAARCQLRRVVSTRFIVDAASMLPVGWDAAKVIGQLTAGWTPDEKSKVGVN